MRPVILKNTETVVITDVDDFRAKLLAYLEECQRRVGGLKVNKSDALRVLITAGLKVEEIGVLEDVLNGSRLLKSVKAKR